jgi:hypothetical protein
MESNVNIKPGKLAIFTGVRLPKFDEINLIVNNTIDYRYMLYNNTVQSHPKHHREMVLELAKEVVKYGKDIALCTNSDFIINEINILILLKSENVRLDVFNQEMKTDYKEHHLLDYKNVEAYDFDEETLWYKKCDVGPNNTIMIDSFDSEIDNQNRLIDGVLYGYFDDDIEEDANVSGDSPNTDEQVEEQNKPLTVDEIAKLLGADVAVKLRDNFSMDPISIMGLALQYNDLLKEANKYRQ